VLSIRGSELTSKAVRGVQGVKGSMSLFDAVSEESSKSGHGDSRDW
jgi:hypothetical protein